MAAIKTTADMRKMLLGCIEGVRDGSLDHKKAKAIADLSSNVLQSVKLDLHAARLLSNGHKVNALPTKLLAQP